MTTYDPKARRLLTESETRAAQIYDSIKELYASRRDISADAIAAGDALEPYAVDALRAISHMIASLQKQLRDLRVAECDCCGEWRSDCMYVAHPSFGDTTACAACRGDFEDDDQEQHWRHETNV